MKFGSTKRFISRRFQKSDETLTDDETVEKKNKEGKIVDKREKKEFYVFFKLRKSTFTNDILRFLSL